MIIMVLAFGVSRTVGGRSRYLELPLLVTWDLGLGRRFGKVYSICVPVVGLQKGYLEYDRLSRPGCPRSPNPHINVFYLFFPA